MRCLASSFSLQMVKAGAILSVRKSDLLEVFSAGECPTEMGYNRGLRAFDLVAIGHQGCADWLSAQCHDYEIVAQGKLLSKGFGAKQAESCGWHRIGGRPIWGRDVAAPIPVNRQEIALLPGDTLVVIQPVAKRLDVGTELGTEAPYQVMIVEVYSPTSRIVEPGWYVAANQALGEKYERR